MSCHPSPSRRPGKHLARGLTLIEALLVLALLGVLMASMWPGWSDHLARRRVEAASAQLQADLEHLRSAAIARDQGLRMTFRSGADGSCYLVHDGDADLCSCPSDGHGQPTPQCAAGAQLLQARAWRPGELLVSANVASFRADPRQGGISPSGSVELRAAGLPALRHVVNLVGRLRLCSVVTDPAAPGWRGVSPC